MIRNVRVAVPLIAFVASACIGADDAALDVGVADHPRYRALRQRLAITFEAPLNGAGLAEDCSAELDAVEPCCNGDFCSARGLGAMLEQGCIDSRSEAWNQDTPTRATGTVCSDEIASLEVHVCVAQRMLEIIESPGAQPIPARGAGAEFGFTSLVIGPQDPESNSELALEALSRLSLAQGRAGEALNWSTSTAPPPVCSQADLNALAFTGTYATGDFATVTQVEELARFYREISILTEDATEHLVASGATVSDSHFSTLADRAEAAALRNAPFASRLASAHALVGGDSELPALGATANTGGLFTRPPLSRNGQQALDLLRAGAMHPYFMRSDFSLEHFLVGGSIFMGSGDIDSLGYRLGRIYDNPDLITAAADDDADEVLRLLGVDRGAIAEARAWIEEEIRAFDRPVGNLGLVLPGASVRPARVLPPENLRDGSVSDFALYAAVRVPPEPRLPAHWSSIVRFDSTVVPSGSSSLAPTWLAATPTSGGLPPGATWGATDAGGTGRVVLTSSSGRTVASLREDAVFRARRLMRNLTLAGSSAALRNARHIISQMLPEGTGGDGSGATDGSGDTEGSILGRARICTRAAQYRVEVDLAAADITTGTGLEVVLGAEGLDCAVRGTIDGFDCTSAELEALMPSTVTPMAPSGGVLFPSRFAVTLPLPAAPNGPAPNTYLVYVVRRSPDLDALRAPGQYEPLIGFMFVPAPTGNSRCIGAPISPDLDRRVADLVGALPSDPARAAVNCTGLPEDLQLPLENELLADAFPEESSWRTFLATAESASAEADALGEEVIRVGLEMDLRAEHEADELERLCGVRLNLSTLFDSFPAATVNASGGTCSLPYYTYVSESNLCALDPIRFIEERELVSAEDLVRLRECVGTQATVPFVALGDQSVCLWQYGDDPSTICRDATTELPCPTVRRDLTDTTAPSECVTPPGADPLLVTGDQLLRLFVHPYPPSDTGDGGGEEAFPCEMIANLRARQYADIALREEAITEILNSGMFNAITFRRVAQRLGWAPIAGNFSRVTFSRSTIASTGWPGAELADGLLWPATQSLSSVSVATLCPGDPPSGDPAADDRGLFCIANVPVGGSAAEVSARARANDMLARAVITARIMAGVSLADEVFVPYLPRGTNSVGVSTSTQVNDQYFRSNEGVLFQDEDGDSSSGTTYDFGDIRAHAEWTTGPGSWWLTCPYDQSVCTNSIGPDALHAAMLVRRIDVTVDAETDVQGNALIFFHDNGSRGGVLEQALRLSGDSTLREPRLGFDARDSRVSHGELTDYFTSEFDFLRHDEALGCLAGCRCYQRPLSCVNARPRLDIRSTRAGNAAYIMGDGISNGDMLNALELVCAAGRIDAPDADLGCDAPPEDIRSVRQMLQAEAFLRCKAERVEEAAAASIVRNLPAEAIEMLRETGPTVLGGDSGEVAAATRELGAALIALSNARYDMASAINGVADQVDQVRSLVSTSQLASQIEELRLVSNILSQVTQCATAVAGTKWDSPASVIGAGVICANSGAQIGLSVAISELSDMAERDRLQGQFAAFDQEVAANMDRMRDAATSVRTQLAAIDAALARMQNARSSARHAMARALFLESDGTDTHFAASSVYRARYNTALFRYRAARQRALTSAFIARRAVEQRLAMPLEAITDDLPTVEAPYRWADELCAIPAIDYREIRSPSDPGAAEPTAPAGYASAYIGDYVSRLRRTVESYNFAFPFRDGTDTVVLSLRDDLFGTRAECSVAAPNVLPQSDFLDALPTDDVTGWEPRGCLPVVSDPDASVVDAHCASARPLTESENPPSVEPASGGSDYGRPAGYELAFGGSPAATSSSRLGQSVFLEEGTYRISWYGRNPASTPEVTYGDAKDALEVFDESGTPLLDDDVRVAVAVTIDDMDGWTRYHNFFRVRGDQLIEVALVSGVTSSLPVMGLRMQVAGVMVEDVTRTASGNLVRPVPNPYAPDPPTIRFNELNAPGPYFGTGPTATRVMAACPDTDGAVFRSRSWSYGCTRVCPDGYDRECDDFVATSRCYHQVSIPFDSDVIEGLLVGTSTGFAGGNYNYRVEQIAVNVVGTGVRTCDGSAGCFGSGNLSYTLLHNGAYPVRNARGETYYAPLFPGRIESARALMAERYLTNPLSSADASLIAGYRRPDFSGRPIAGGLTLRIWDEPGLNFDAIEDVQLVIDYRYWTHQR